MNNEQDKLFRHLKRSTFQEVWDAVDNYKNGPNRTFVSSFDEAGKLVQLAGMVKVIESLGWTIEEYVYHAGRKHLKDTVESFNTRIAAQAKELGGTLTSASVEWDL